MDSAGLELIKRNTVEIVEEKELIELFDRKKHPVTYCGYETSGPVHLGHLVTITKLMDLMKVGCKVKVLFADWHTYLNRKGEWDFIHEQAKAWQETFKKAGLSDAEFVLGSSFQRNLNYFDDLLKMSLDTTLQRALRSMQEIARDIEHAKVSQIIYPFMQVEDIKALGVEIAQAGIEQRKIHMLARELLPLLNYRAPVCVHSPLIPSLQKSGKMSSSVPESHIALNDPPEVIQKKVAKAYCPEALTEDNPIFAIAQLLILPRVGKLEVRRPAKHGGDITISSYDELNTLYLSKGLHPQDLKTAVAQALVEDLSIFR
jgi:tyrosyl-tRNA synthetase